MAIRYAPSRVAQIGRKKFTHDFDDDSDEDDHPKMGSTVDDPSIDLFKSIDFGRNNKSFKGKFEGGRLSDQNTTFSNHLSDEKNLEERHVVTYKVESTTQNYQPVNFNRNNGQMISSGYHQNSSKSRPSKNNSDELDRMGGTIELDQISDKVSKSVAISLIKERDELRQRMEEMQKEKLQLTKNLRLTEAAARLQNETLPKSTADLQQTALAEQLSKEKLSLLTTMAQVEQEKKELALRLAENQDQVQRVSATAAQTLAKERQEIREQLARMEREKEELAKQLQSTEVQANRVKQLEMERSQHMDQLQSAIAEAERHKALAAAASQAAQENERLRLAMESMRSNNEALSRRLQDENLQSQQLHDRETQMRREMEERMEADKLRLTQQLLDMQKESESLLAKERERFNAALRNMEDEKAELQNRVRATQEQARRDEEALAKHRESFAENMSKVEAEKNALANLVAEKEEKAKKASKAVAAVLAKESEQLRQRMEEMQQEKSLLTSSLQSAERAAQQQAESLAKQLQTEREALQESLERTKREKLELAQHLAATEIQTQTQTAALTDQLSKEKLSLLTTMAQVEQEKKELALRLAENQDQVQRVSATAAQTLAKERQEIREQLARMEREKEELAKQLQSTEVQANRVKQLEMERSQHMDQLQSAIAEAERHKALAAAASQAAQENEKLRLAMESMRSNNEALSRRLQDENLQSQQLHDRETQMRREMEERMEADKLRLTQQLLDMQKESESLLAKERERFNAALRNMEDEKAELQSRVRATQEQAKRDEEALAKHRESFAENMSKVEAEKNALANLVAENEEKAKKASKAVAAVLAKEREELRQRMEEMQQEKTLLTSSLQSAERAAQQQAESLAKQLQTEREALQESLERTKREKLELAQHLAATEIQTQTQTAALTDQLSKEKLSLLTTMAQVEQEKKELALRLAENQDQVQRVSATAAQTLAKERQEIREQLARMEREKEELAKLLQKTENQSREREQLVAERLEREKDELKSTVERMKAQFKEEKKILAQALAQKQSSRPGSGISLKPKRSLYDLMSDDERSVALGSFMSRSIAPIREVDESVVGEDDDATLSDDESTTLQSLPAVHAAAAVGDVKKLKEFAKQNRNLLLSYDDTHRTPLFYAVAYDQLAAADYLTLIVPESIQMPDEHGDLPLHAATSAGSVGCVEMVAKAMGKYVDCRNHMNMSPTHLARNRDCLEVLYRYGVSLEVTDNNGRSPLFVACAMNRSECAEYIIDCLDDEAMLYVADIRGDTPLHAAACNGSADCLLLLLQHAIDPRTANQKGLKAIDLAIKNKQDKCRELLAEYHLHYCTKSQLDSVLFLAALEGHKHVQSTLQSEEGYEIIKKITKGSLQQTPEALFSLQHNKSLRLLHLGSWIAYEDRTAASTYYYNHKTGKGQWEVPEKVKNLKHLSSVDSVDVTARLSHAKTSMRLKKTGDWLEYCTELGQTFYFNEVTGDFQWIDPNLNPEESSSQSTEHEAQYQPQVEESLADWRAYKDPESGCVFWHNAVTNISQWECPHPTGTTTGSTAVSDSDYGSRRNRRRRGSGQEEQDVVEVYNDDDLGI